MAKKKTLNGMPSTASYEGLCSRITDLVGMKSIRPSAAWELNVADRLFTVLKFNRPDLLEQVRQAMKEEYSVGKRPMPEHVSEEGSTIRCPACGKAR